MRRLTMSGYPTLSRASFAPPVASARPRSGRILQWFDRYYDRFPVNVIKSAEPRVNLGPAHFTVEAA
jgi:hypothetical protein